MCICWCVIYINISPRFVCSLCLSFLAVSHFRNENLSLCGRDNLCTIMLNKGIPTHLITIIQEIYMENVIKVNVGNGISDDSRASTQGVRQGCPLSPLLM